MPIIVRSSGLLYVDWSFYKKFDNVIYSEIKTSKLTLIYVACGMVGSLIKRSIEHLHGS